jgi:transketolase
VVVGDGESNQGQVWEAAMAAAKYQVHNLTAIFDFNRFQQTGPMQEVMPSMQPVAEKWRAFGWDVTEIDGHQIDQIQDALGHVQTVRTRPQVIIAHTHKGKLLTPFEDDVQGRKHGVTLTKEEAEVALRELEDRFNHRGDTSPPAEKRAGAERRAGRA